MKVQYSFLASSLMSLRKYKVKDSSPKLIPCTKSRSQFLDRVSQSLHKVSVSFSVQSRRTVNLCTLVCEGRLFTLNHSSWLAQKVGINAWVKKDFFFSQLLQLAETKSRYPCRGQERFFSLNYCSWCVQ